MAQCRECGETIEWGLTRRQRWMPLSADPGERYTLDGERRARRVDTFVSHFAVCGKRAETPGQPSLPLGERSLASLKSSDEDPRWHVRLLEPAFTERASESHDVELADPGCEDEIWHVRQLEPAC